MKIDEAKRLLLIERECVKRNDGINCNRQCEKCDLVQDADKIIEMYNNVADWLEEYKAHKEICNATDVEYVGLAVLVVGE